MATLQLRELLGGKGANLAEMARIGLPVPPGFTITTEVCTYFYANGRQYPKTLAKEVKASVAGIEKQLGKKLGAEKKPAASLRPLRCARVHAGHDGHHPQPWPQRQDG